MLLTGEHIMPKLPVGWGPRPDVPWSAEGVPYCFKADALMLKKIFILLLFSFLIIGGVAATLEWPETLSSLS